MLLVLETESTKAVLELVGDRLYCVGASGAVAAPASVSRVSGTGFLGRAGAAPSAFSPEAFQG